MQQKLLLRELYGSNTFVTVLPDNQVVPWKLLSLGDYLKYDHSLQTGEYPEAYLENEIFKKCVLNPILVQEIDNLNAGIVHTVAQHIVSKSAPKTLEEMIAYLNLARIEANQFLHTLVNFVCVGFPAYKPEDLYQMDIDTFMLRVAQSERKQLETGLLKEPLNCDQTPQTQVKEHTKTRLSQKVPEPPKENLAQKYREQKNSGTSRTVITQRDIKEIETALTGHELFDRDLLSKRMLADSVGLYKDYLEQMKAGKSVTIKTDEERKADATKRAQINKKEYQRKLQAKLAEEQKVDEAISKKLAQARKAKKHSQIKKR